MRRDIVTVSSFALDSALDSVQANIDPMILDTVQGPGMEIRDKLKVRSDADQKFMTLDLVSHSFGDSHLLLLGDGEPNESRFLIEKKPGNLWMNHFDPELKTIIDRLHIRKLRLLGCLTAFTADGREAMNALKTALELDEVLGTRDYLSALDFDQGGFKEDSSGKLADSSFVPGQNPPELPKHGPGVLELEDLDSVTALPEEELQKLTRLKGFVDRRKLLDFGRAQTKRLFDAIGKDNRKAGKWLPGKLAVPLKEYWIQSERNPDAYRLVHVFFDWRVMAVYSSNLMIPTSSHVRGPFTDGAFYPVADPDAFKELMTTHGSQTPIAPAHSPRSKEH